MLSTSAFNWPERKSVMNRPTSVFKSNIFESAAFDFYVYMSWFLRVSILRLVRVPDEYGVGKGCHQHTVGCGTMPPQLSTYELLRVM